ncbi:phage head morphogenesis protein [Salmonella enterica subsp. houtenae serovar 40:z4,z24:-]|nr:phage head morphogenesis protein [Salmonella enterica subsp. houtenae serovar 40:z4,z24:-]EDX6934856.1 phage head morphogenesis protein [Salmonella enterica subsp. houtenae serovar 40:z4,z24:-]
MAMDASPANELKRRLAKLGKQWESKFNELAKKLADRFVDKTLRNTDVSLHSALKAGGFTVKFTMNDELKDAMQAVINENVNLIKSIPEHYHTQVETMVMQSVSRGRDLGYLTDELVKRYGITRRRAETIARDQNAKATSVIQSVRQRNLGITHGIWRHSHAGKVPRQSHVKADGKKFELSKGLMIDGKLTFPGHEINCRCTWSIVLPGLD